MHLKWLDLRETGTSYEADWEKEDQRLAALVSVDGKVMSKEESEAKAAELEQEFTERYLQWMRDLEASVVAPRCCLSGGSRASRG